MFGSTMLDVIIGVVTVFLGISLAASAVTDGLSALFNVRANTLLSGIKQLLNDQTLQGLAGDIYAHGLVNPLSDGRPATGGQPLSTPSYIDSAHFAVALIETIQSKSPDAKTMQNAIDAMPNPQVKAALSALYQRAGGDADRFHTAVAGWFDHAMDHVSADYKRRTKLITFIAGFLIAATLNADPVRISETLWQRPLAAQSLQKIALPTADAATQGAQALGILKQLNSVGPLLGWDGVVPASISVAGWLLTVAGWLLTAGSTLFGAPFWFDTLQRFVPIRGTGKAASAPAPAA